MRLKTPFRTLLTAAGLVLLGAACSPERAVAPPPAAPAAPAASAGLLSGVTGLLSGTLGSLTTVPVIQRTTALPADVSTAQVITPLGGTMRIASAGVTIVFAPGAVSVPTKITVTAFAGTAVAYGFEPHGIQFAQPVTVTQDMTLTTIANNTTALSQVQAGYFPDGKSDLHSDGTALVSELLPVKLLLGTITGLLNSLLGVRIETASFVIHHFSGYLLCGA